MSRMLVLWCPDWPVVAAGRAAGGVSMTAPAAVFSANRVVAASASARDLGVSRGERRRVAQSRCPELVVFAADSTRDARMFEPVAAAVEALAPGVEVVRPGLIALAARGAAVAFGGEHAVAEHLVDHVASEVGVECQIGIADGLFAASVAARGGRIVAAGKAREFLAPLSTAELTEPLEELDSDTHKTRTELVDLLRRMGIRTLGSFADLDERDVTSRFGTQALRVHGLARAVYRLPPVRRAVA